MSALSHNPLRRDDLDVAGREIDGETVYFVGDPLTNEFKQLDDLQFVVFEMLDGKRTLADMARELEEDYEVEVDLEDLEEFILGLGEMDLLDPSSFAATRAFDREAAQLILARLRRRGIVYGRRDAVGVHIPLGGRERRVQTQESIAFDRGLEALDNGDIQGAAAQLRAVLKKNPANFRARYLMRELMLELVGEKQNMDSIWLWRFPLLNPDRFLERLDRAIGSAVFSRIFSVAYLLSMATCFLLLLFDVDRVIADFRNILSFGWLLEHPLALPLLWLMGIVTLAGHEGSHGLTCKHYGGRVREMGLLLLYMSPTAYCDVSSTYLMEKRYQRVLVSLAGVTFEFLTWMVCVYIWSFVRSDTTLGIVCFVMVLNGPSYLQSLQPIVRSDGYLVLSELVGHPNLRTDAFEYLRLRGAQLFLGEEVEIPEELHAHRKTFLWYAIPGGIGTVLFIGTVMSVVITTLIEQLHTIGIILGAVLVWGALGTSLFTVLKLAWQHRARLRASRRARRLSLAIVAVAVAIVVAPVPLTLEARCETHPSIKQVRTQITGAVAKITVRDGQRVRAGEVLIELDRTSLEVAVARSKAERRGAELDLAKLKKRVRDEELGIAEARLAGQVALLRSSQRRLNRLQRLASSSLVSRDEVERLQSLRERARTGVADASGELRALQANALEAEVDAAEALIEMLSAQVDEDERNLASATIRSPVDGYVYLEMPVEELQGSVVEQAAKLASVREVGGERLELMVPITAPVDVVEIGARVQARLRGAPYRKLEGKLIEVGAAFEETETEITGVTESMIRAEVALDDEERVRDLPRGLSGNAEINAGLYPLAYHAYLRLVRLIEVDLNILLTSLG